MSAGRPLLTLEENIAIKPKIRCQTCTTRAGNRLPRYLIHGEWTFIFDPARYFGDEAQFEHAECPECAFRRLDAWHEALKAEQRKLIDCAGREEELLDVQDSIRFTVEEKAKIMKQVNGLE